NLEEKRGKPARYRIGNPLPEELVVLPERVCSAQCTAPCTVPCTGIPRSEHGLPGMCSCAPTAEGIDPGICTACRRRYRPPNESGLCYDCRSRATKTATHREKVRA